jgi:hypothetical protein
MTDQLLAVAVRSLSTAVDGAARWPTSRRCSSQDAVDWCLVDLLEPPTS